MSVSTTDLERETRTSSGEGGLPGATAGMSFVLPVAVGNLLAARSAPEMGESWSSRAPGGCKPRSLAVEGVESDLEEWESDLEEWESDLEEWESDLEEWESDLEEWSDTLWPIFFFDSF